ncbi:MAG: hypothetical protein HY720_05165 [Planctomycetes bacterium]|nr:hypothetical protein [Planctomycetota bacterium]
MLRAITTLVLASTFLLSACQNHEHDPYDQAYKVDSTYSVEYEYEPTPHPEFNYYQDHYGHEHEYRHLNASHGGYGSYGVLYEE